MEVTEMNNCLSKFYLLARKQDGSHYKKTNLLSIRAALDRYLRSPPINKKFSICDTIQFNEANKALNSYLKHLASTGKITGTVRKNPSTAEVVQKLFEAGELACAETKNLSRFAANNMVLRFSLSQQKRERKPKFNEEIYAPSDGDSHR